jgi:hypothetical protein
MRDSNPQPPDSKSDTLSIAPTAPRKQLYAIKTTTTMHTHQPTTNTLTCTTHTRKHTQHANKPQNTNQTYTNINFNIQTDHTPTHTSDLAHNRPPRHHHPIVAQTLYTATRLADPTVRRFDSIIQRLVSLFASWAGLLSRACAEPGSELALHLTAMFDSHRVPS